ncbi:MAG: UTP--glucose-1-phosphate uridylyltransferase [Puniceicoccaceae bacterium]
MSSKAAESPFIETLLGRSAEDFDRSVESLSGERSLKDLIEDSEVLEEFWRSTDNLYLRVRALVYLYHLHRFTLPESISAESAAAVGCSANDLEPVPIPLEAHRALQSRNFQEAIDFLVMKGRIARLNVTLSSGLATAYHALALQSLADQVRRSVRQEIGNQWMFRIGHPDDYPLRVVSGLRNSLDKHQPWLIEQTSVRMDLSHSSWSDIFFLGMDRPEFAKVINVSIDLAISGSEIGPVPPCLAALRVIDRPVVRLVSIDLENSAEIDDLNTLFDFGRDYLGLLKAALIASGLVPPGMEGSRTPLDRLLTRLVGPGKGLELVSWVRDIPKGSRLAVSTNLLGCLIAVCMRATGQIKNLDGGMSEEERRIVASRAILGEWLGGSGGGWQDSGGVWPGAKLIEGCLIDGQIANPLPPSSERIIETESNPETRDSGHETARGALLPRHTRLDGDYIPNESIQALEDSLILIHGGMAANVGPILEMVTERYLLRSELEWQARAESLSCTGRIMEELRSGSIRDMGMATTEHFFGPLKDIIPWSSNAFTERMIREVSESLESQLGHDSKGDDNKQIGTARLGEVFWGFWMLGGMSGGGMGLIVNPAYRERAKPVIGEILSRLKSEYENALPFAMDPVIYDFKINRNGSICRKLSPAQAGNGDNGEAAVAGESFLKEYLRYQLPGLLQKHPSERSQQNGMDLECVRKLSLDHASGFLLSLVPEELSRTDGHADGMDLDTLLQLNGFDRTQHEQIRDDLRAGRVGLSQNRLPSKTIIEDVGRDELQFKFDRDECRKVGKAALEDGKCAVLTLAAGAGSRWTQGAGVVKALHPFAPINGVFRSFLEIHVAKSAAAARSAGCRVPHVFTTSYLTDDPIRKWLKGFEANYADICQDVNLCLSPGKSVGLRMIPMLRDLRYAWYELPQEKLDEQAEKMRESVRQALMRWASDVGEGSDYRDNLPMQCLHPVGHWYELPNMLLNGTLHRLLKEQPSLEVILLHNIDTLGASLDPELVGHHLLSKSILTYEVIQRKFEDVGGGLAKVDGVMRLVEGFALPREEDEFRLSYYNTLSTWISVNDLLGLFGLSRENVLDPAFLPGGASFPILQDAVRKVASRMPTYLTLKETKKRWGRGQEDIFPVLQFERLWGDMSAYIASQGKGSASFVEVSRLRGQQLKDPAQLDAWSREGSLDHYADRVGSIL